MNFGPLDNLLAAVIDPDGDRSWLWNPLHPSAMFCALCIVAVTLLLGLLTRGG